MPLPKYTYTGPIDHTTIPNLANAKGKSIIVTGGANGMGEAMVRAFSAAGAFVTFGDLHPRGDDLAKELNAESEKTAFVKCDIRDWDSLITLFDTAKAKSPHHSVDVVIANAGISRSSGDSLWNLDDPNGPPTKPDLNIVRVNMDGTFYTWKLAVHYFRNQPDSEDRDRCFIITGSMTAYIDSPGNWEYTATKYGLRGFMKTARRSSWEQGIRINYVAPCWIKSAIRTKEYEAWLIEHGIEFGEQADCAGAMMRIACDKTINGRSLMITPRTVAKEGFVDVDREDYTEPKDEYFIKKQATQLRIIEDKWLDDYKGQRHKGVNPIPSSMYAWRKHKGNPEPVWEEVPVPSTPARGFLIKMIASGGEYLTVGFGPEMTVSENEANRCVSVCHSDHSLLTNEKQRPWFQDKYTLGHEGCGEIVKVGDQVKNAGFKVGDRIATIAVPGCGSDDCPECSRDLAQLCEQAHHAGIGQDGFYAPYAALDIRAVVRVPDGIPSSVTAVATDAVKTSYHAITRRAKVKRHETIFLFGLGGLGFNALQIVLHIGARVIVSDIRQERLEEAVRFGVPRQDIVPAGKSVQEFVHENGLQGKIDTTLDFVGKHQTFEDAQRIVRRGGKLLCVGTFDEENTVDMKIGIRKRLDIIFTYGGQLRDLKEVLDLISKRILQPQVETAGLKDFPRVLKDLCDGKIKARVALLHE
ncbi:Short-chain dehydrogenase/reductase SDR [Penicillium riverlandense]|uniref:Short-chain dehydrogenase/reductase SDR n=1 Tax=Penicillium riverlandense TaxID=1903569 RepID=UPI002549B276|nr:Short-chain dehydrogenase/reductase SDR [Penicillium riverlandense]KAJ5825866.1 Short-chain dehydrogenase/reductase SDR [Penicillium riverlandense]